MASLAATPPAWVMPGAAYDLDFANGRYYGGSVFLGLCTTNSQVIQSLVNGPGNGVAGIAPSATGSPLAAFAAYVPRVTPGYGLWAEGNYTNYALWARDLTTGSSAAWAKTNMTVAKDQPSSVSGTANICSSILSTAANATCLQSLTGLASHAYCFSAYVKRLTGTGTVSITNDGTTYTDVTGQINSAAYTLVSCPAQTLTTANCGFKLATSGDKIAVDYAQFENNAYPSTPLATTSATVARGVDEPAHSDPSQSHVGGGLAVVRNLICTGGPWSVFVAAAGNSQNTSHILSDGGVTIGIGCGGGSGSFAAGAAAATTANAGTFGLGNVNKLCGRAAGSNAYACLNGGAVAASASGNPITAPGAAFTHIGLGNNGAATSTLDGYIKRIAYWNRELTDGEMVTYSAPTSPYGN